MSQPHEASAAALAASRIRILRGQKVLLDFDLAALYGVETRRLNEQVRRNPHRFPAEFMFQLDPAEMAALMSQIAISNGGRGGRRKAALAFTEHGALMAATVLNSRRAVEVSLYVVRAFVRLRETLAANKDLAHRLDELERNVQRLGLEHQTFAGDTRLQLRQLFEAIRELLAPAAPRTKRPIGFVTESPGKRN
jgi:ORF6N domain-containing protein